MMITLMLLTVIVCTNGSLCDSVHQFGKRNVYLTGHRTICLVVLTELHVVSVLGAVLPAAPCDSFQNHGHPPL